MTDLLAILVWPFAMTVSALLFSLFMYWRITREDSAKAVTRAKPTHTMAE